jgi:hypothetical protein
MNYGSYKQELTEIYSKSSFKEKERKFRLCELKF